VSRSPDGSLVVLRTDADWRIRSAQQNHSDWHLRALCRRAQSDSRVHSRRDANTDTSTGFCIIGYIFSVFCYPETKGISVDETQEIFADGFGIQKSADMRREKIALAKEMRNEA
jgi:hypothetical protein